MHIHINHTHLQNWSVSLCYFATGILNDCYSEETAYTALVFYEVYGYQGHAHWWLQRQLPYKTIELS